MNIEQRLEKILKDAGVDTGTVSLESSLSDLGIDSLDLVEIIMNIEGEFGIEFDNDELNKLNNLKCLGDVLTLIREKL